MSRVKDKSRRTQSLRTEDHETLRHRLAALIECDDQAIAVCDAHGRILVCNSALAVLAGMEPAAVQGREI